jgi:hypothetical protein
LRDAFPSVAAARRLRHADLVLISCLTPWHSALAAVASSLETLVAFGSRLSLSGSNYINRVADALGVVLEPEMKR